MTNTGFEKTKLAIEKDVEGFQVAKKDESKFQLFLCKALALFKYKTVWTSLYPKVWKPLTDDERRLFNYAILQHEWVHLKDNQTMCGLSDKKYKYLNIFLFTLLYAFPQVLALLAFLFFVNKWFLLFGLFILPWPAPFRWYFEIRAYRRTMELTRERDKELGKEKISESLSSAKYYWCWPFKDSTKKNLTQPSPYKDEMDDVLEG